MKRTAEELDEPDAMVEFLEILNADTEGEDQTYIMLENGEWTPEEMSRAGDLKEAQGERHDQITVVLAGRGVHQSLWR